MDELLGSQQTQLEQLARYTKVQKRDDGLYLICRIVLKSDVYYTICDELTKQSGVYHAGFDTLYGVPVEMRDDIHLPFQVHYKRVGDATPLDKHMVFID